MTLLENGHDSSEGQLEGSSGKKGKDQVQVDDICLQRSDQVPTQKRAQEKVDNPEKKIDLLRTERHNGQAQVAAPLPAWVAHCGVSHAPDLIEWNMRNFVLT